MISKRKFSPRYTEALLLALIWVIASLGFWMVTAAQHVQQEQSLLPDAALALLPPLVLVAALFSVHLALSLRGVQMEQVLLPIAGLLVAIGLVMIYRLQGFSGAWQQLTRGLLPGVLMMHVLIAWPRLLERLRQWALLISLLGLLLPFATALFGEVDESGARLALKLGPLPAIQTSEIIKLALVIFLAWFIEREGLKAEGRARPILGWLRLPGLQYFVPGGLFTAFATLSLVAMADFGAVLILGCLFVAILYAGFETRIFATVALIGVVLALVAGLALALTWDLPTVIRYRFMAYQDPWSSAMIMIDGQPAGITVSEGPGYQIQQAIYAVIAGGLAGTGLGFGSPEYVPLAHSDFIYAAIVEEMGAAIGICVLILFTILLLRILRAALILPDGQVFERLLLIGVGVHLFTQVFIMVGGTLNLIPTTGITIPFMSLGGTAVMVNLTEIGFVLSAIRRQEGLAS